MTVQLPETSNGVDGADGPSGEAEANVTITVVMTTAPFRAIPSTEIIAATIDSLALVGHAHAFLCQHV